MLNSNCITRQIEEYIVYKRSLGYVIKIESQELKRFAKYTRDIGHDGSLTAELAIRWASLDNNFTRKYMARRLETLHTFAVYISAFDAQAQILHMALSAKRTCVLLHISIQMVKFCR
jgi:hypothetical protein